MEEELGCCQSEPHAQLLQGIALLPITLCWPKELLGAHLTWLVSHTQSLEARALATATYMLQTGGVCLCKQIQHSSTSLSIIGVTAYHALNGCNGDLFPFIILVKFPKILQKEVPRRESCPSSTTVVMLSCAARARPA